MEFADVQEYTGTYKTTQGRTRPNITIQNHTAPHKIMQDRIGPRVGYSPGAREPGSQAPAKSSGSHEM